LLFQSISNRRICRDALAGHAMRPRFSKRVTIKYSRFWLNPFLFFIRLDRKRYRLNSLFGNMLMRRKS